MSPVSRTLASLLAVALLASGCISAPSDAQALKVRFEDAGVLIRGNDVKVAGVPVGIVSAFDVVDGEAELTLEISREQVPEVHRDAQVAVRPVSLLGERYIELDPGTPDAGLLAVGEPIPSSQTRRAVELDEVLDALDDPVSVELAGLIEALGRGVGGRSEELGTTIDIAPDALDATAELVAVLGAQNRQIAALVDQTGPVAEALAESDGAPLRTMVDGANELLRSTAADTQALDGTVAQLPDTLASALDALGQLDRVARAADPVLDDLRPITDDLVAISGELEGFAGAARQAVDELPDVVDAAEPVVGDLAASGDELTAIADDLADLGPAAQELAGHVEPDWDFVLQFVRNWARVTQQRDATGHYFRVLPIYNTRSVQHGPKPPATPFDPQEDAEEGSDDRPDSPLLGLGSPSLGGLGDALGGGLTSSDDSSSDTSAGPSDSATGLEEDEERSLLDFVLGGPR